MNKEFVEDMLKCESRGRRGEGKSAEELEALEIIQEGRKECYKGEKWKFRGSEVSQEKEMKE